MKKCAFLSVLRTQTFLVLAAVFKTVFCITKFNLFKICVRVLHK